MAFLASQPSPSHFCDQRRNRCGQHSRLHMDFSITTARNAHVGHCARATQAEASGGTLPVLAEHVKGIGRRSPVEIDHARQLSAEMRNPTEVSGVFTDFTTIMGDTAHGSTLSKYQLTECSVKWTCCEEFRHDCAGFPRGRVSLIRALGLIARLGCWDYGRRLHGLIVKSGLAYNRFIATSLLDMYAKSGDLESACAVFDRMIDVDVISWNSLISGFASNGILNQALDLFLCVLNAGTAPNHYTLSIILGICGDLLSFEEGKQIHAYAIKSQFSLETAVANALMTMYGKCGMIKEAEVLFENIPLRNVISWTALTAAFYQNKCFEQALRQFCLMRLCGVEPNDYTYVISLACCGCLKLLNCGKGIHAHVLKSGHASDVFITTAIVDMYSGCTEMSDAEKQLEEVVDVEMEAPWNALLSGYIRNGRCDEAIKAFGRMSKICTSFNHFTYSIMLKACSSIPSLASGEQIHAQILKTKYESNIHVESSLIEMYSKCGSLVEAEQVFIHMHVKDIVAWNSMLKAYAQNGSSRQALLLYHQMMKEGIRPTGSTFLTILSACSHSRLIREGLEIFELMLHSFGLEPEEAHYVCVVDLLSRGGLIEEAKDFINRLPIGSTASIWRPLLAASRSYHHVQMSEYVARHILDIEPDDPTVYVTLSNVYMDNGRWSDAVNQRLLMADKEVKKEPGCSWIEVNNKVYKFFSSDKTNEQTTEIYDLLSKFARQIREVHSIPGTNHWLLV